MSDGMRRELAYLSSHATNRYFIPNWGRLYKMAFFDVAKTPDFMKKLGLTGDRFTIKYGVLSRHAGKDDSHSLTEKLWEELPDALQKPFAITRFGGKDKGYRLYTTMKNENGETIVVGVDVKNVGRDMEVNAISTIFGRRGDAKKTQKEDVLYTAENITPEQRSLLGQPNSDQYTGVRERNVSTDKGSEKAEKKQEKQSVFDKANTALSFKNVLFSRKACYFIGGVMSE